MINRNKGLFSPGITLAIIAFCIAGCGTGDGVQRGAVDGSVTFEGAPLADGLIRFVPSGSTTGAMVEAKIVAGAFTLSESVGPCVGTQRVEIYSFQKTGKVLKNEGMESEEILQVIPKQYNSESILTADIAAGTNTLSTFALDK